MSNDAKVTTDLLETLRDGEQGFAAAADRLTETDRPDLADEFRRYSQQRAVFATELESLAARYGDDLDESGSAAGALHRAWMAVMDTLAGSAPDGVLEAAEQGESHTVTAYADALNQDISPELRAVVERQQADIHRAHERVTALRALVG